MNSAEYKEICGRADVLPRGILEETRAILVQGKVAELSVVSKALLEGFVEFPENHSGDPEASYHKVTCSSEQADNIADFLFEKEADSVPVSGIGTSETSKLIQLVNIWHELAEYV